MFRKKPVTRITEGQSDHVCISACPLATITGDEADPFKSTGNLELPRVNMPIDRKVCLETLHRRADFEM